MLFFGSDRYDNSGDAQQGFWFFQDAVGLGTQPVGGGTGFVGKHVAGDILVISDFSNGGTTSTITVYKWDPTCTKAGGSCGDINLRTLETSTSALCSSTLPGTDQFCGIVNPKNGTAVPWSFLDKSGNNTYLQGEFYEGGINLSDLGLSGECFAAMSSETRSSTSTTATLKDFALGSFGDCTTKVKTTPVASDGTTAIPAAGVSIGTGSVTVKDSATVTVAGAATWTGNLQFSLCGPLATDPSASDCTSGGTAIGSPITVTNSTTQPIVSPGATLTSAGTYCWNATFTSGTTGVPNGSDGTSTECFKVTPVTPSLATQAGPAVTVGNAVTDTATLTGLANKPGTPVINPTAPGGPAGGTITFKLYGPSAPGTCGTLVYTSSATSIGDLAEGGRGATATSLVINTAGTYHWVATYSGDSPNTLGTDHNTACNDTSEDVVVGASSVVTTPKTGDGSATLTSTSITTSGSVTASDSAAVNVTGATTWSGTLVFHLCGPLATTPSASSCTSGGTLIGDAGGMTVTNATTEPVLGPTATITAAGTYCWRADFSGDATHGVPAASDGSSGECFSITPVTPDLTTTAGPDVPVGSAVTDRATLTGWANEPGTPVIDPLTPGGPAGGTITFTLYGPDDCSTVAYGPTGVPVTDLTSPTARGAEITSGTLTKAGTYHWVASYSGDSPNTLSATHNLDCSQAAEDVIVSGSSVVTTPKDGSGASIPSGGLSIGTGSVTATDSAVVSVTGKTTWSGTVQFSLCGTPATDCTSGGTAIGLPVAVSDNDSTVLSPVATITSAGTYCWRADFTSGTGGVPGATDGSATECFTVNPVTPDLTTQAGGTVSVGQAVTDTATLTGWADEPGSPVINPSTDGGAATGTITFHLFGPSTTGCGDEVTPVFGITKSVTLNPDGTLTATADFTPSLPGTYHWVAYYSGDSPNTLATDHNTKCDDTNEDVIVTQYQPVISTAQSWLPNDTATLTVDGGGNLTGSIVFSLFASSDCSGDPLYQSGDISVNGPSGTQVTSDNTSVYVTASGTVSWLVTYTSTNIAHLGVTSTCHTEYTDLTINNG